METPNTNYRVTREFVTGSLAGLSHTGVTSVKFEVGREYKPCAGGSAYVVTGCTPLATAADGYDEMEQGR